jgi:gas vesicle protein
MKDNTGKIILSLLAGATAGAVAGLLLAPETGEGTRASLKRSATKLSDDLGNVFKQGLARFGGAQTAAAAETEAAPETQADAEQANSALDALTASTPKPRKAKSTSKKTAASTDATAGTDAVASTDYAPVTVPRDEDTPPTFDDFNSDYDGSGSEGRHTGNPSFGQTL